MIALEIFCNFFKLPHFLKIQLQNILCAFKYFFILVLSHIVWNFFFAYFSHCVFLIHFFQRALNKQKNTETDRLPQNQSHTLSNFHTHKLNFFASQNSVNYKNSRQQEDGRLYRRRHDPIIFMLHHTTTEPIEKTPEAANRSIDDRTSYKFCAYRYASSHIV